MKNTGFRFLLRAWLALTSIAVFLGGWVVLGHSPKPAETSSSSSSTVTQLAPLPTLAFPVEQDAGSSIRQVQPSFQFAQPSFRTRGS